MPGGSAAHSIITVNISAELGNALKGWEYVAFASCLRIKVERTGLITYADVTVAGAEQRFGINDEELLLNPVLIVEVLSKSTEKYDRGRKFQHYQAIASLKEYMLVSQHMARVELLVREGGGTWRLYQMEGLEGKITSPTLGVTLELKEIFANVTFEPRSIR